MNILDPEFMGLLTLIIGAAIALTCYGFGFYRATVEAERENARLVKVYETLIARSWRNGYDTGVVDRATDAAELGVRENPFITWG
jgi:hypothetical protein